MINSTDKKDVALVIISGLFLIGFLTLLILFDIAIFNNISTLCGLFSVIGEFTIACFTTLVILSQI